MRNEAMDDLKATFFEECAELMEDLFDNLDAFSGGQTDQETINTIFRSVHSIKGGAGAFGLDALVSFAHAFENALDALRAGRLSVSPKLCKLFLQAADVLGDVIEAAKSGQCADEDHVEHVCGCLNELVCQNEVDTAPAFKPQPLALPGFIAGPLDKPAAQSVEFRPLATLYANGNDPMPTLALLSAAQRDTLVCEFAAVPNLDDISPEESYLSWSFQSPGTVTKQDLKDQFEFLEGVCELAISQTNPPSPSLEAAPAPALAKQRAEPHNSTVRVDLERIDRLVNLVGELVINQSMLSQHISAMDVKIGAEVGAGLEEFMRLTRDIQDSVMMIRAQPVKSLFQRMSRIVRDTAAASGKTAVFVTEGEATEIDKTVLEQLSEPLTHIIRNAIDHGLEGPEIRRQAGKPEAGKISLSASHKSGRVILEISDDGAGLDRGKIRATAIERGLIADEDALSDIEIDALLFQPGFSTATIVSDLSGRGVGMDVVKRSIQSLGGTVSIRSEHGTGTRLIISLPLTLAILDSMVVTAAEQTFVLPLSPIVETMRLAEAVLGTLGREAEVITIRGNVLPLVRLSQSLGLSAPSAQESRAVLIIDNGDGHPYALVVDSIEEQRQVVIKGFQAGHGLSVGVSWGDYSRERAGIIHHRPDFAPPVEPAPSAPTNRGCGMSLDESNHVSDSLDHLSFLVGDEVYCLDISLVREIRSWSAITPLPHAPSFMRGVINLRGTVLPIIDLSLRLGLPETIQGQRTVIIVVGDRAQSYGLLVNAVSDILSIPNDDLKPPPNIGGTDVGQFLNAVAVLDDQLVKALDLMAIIPHPVDGPSDGLSN